MKMLNSRTLRAVLGLAIIVLLVLLSDPAEIIAVLGHCDITYIVISLALMALVLILRAHRWWMVSRGIGLPLPFMLLVELTAVSSFFNLFLPGSIGGDAYRAYSVAQISDRKLRSLAGVVIERMTGLVALMAVCVAAVAWSYRMLPIHPAIIISFCVAVVIVLAAGFWAVARASWLYEKFHRWIPVKIATRVPRERWQVMIKVAEDVTSRKGVFAASLLTGLLLQIVVIATYYTTSLALGKNIPPHYFFVFFPLIELAGMIPVTINGLGVKESLIVVSLRYASISPATSIGLAILNRLLAAAVALVGGVIWMIRRDRMKTAPSV